MKHLLSEPTSHLPLIDFSGNGKLKLEGKAIPEDASKLFNPMIDFVSQLTSPKVIFDIRLEYFNTSSSKKVMDLLNQLDKNKNVDDITVNWHYETGDEDSLETAEIYAEFLSRTRFLFSEYPEA